MPTLIWMSPTMPLDDRIRQLSETLLEEVRGPIEVALQNVLAEVMKLAADDRDEAVRTAVAAADERHQDLVTRLSAAVAHAEQEQHRAEVERALVQQALQEARADALESRVAAAAAAENLASVRVAADSAEQNLVSAHVADRERELACTDRMLTAFRQLDAAPSLTEVLNALADSTAAETGRAAVLVVSGSRLHGWVFRGLGMAEPATIDVPVEPYTVFGLALEQGRAVTTAEAPVGAEADPLSTLLAAPAGSAGLAIPISVGGRPVAILYADDAGDREPVVPSTWPELVEILACHAGRCLEVLTMSRAKAPAASAHPPDGGDSELPGRR